LVKELKAKLGRLRKEYKATTGPAISL